MSINLDGLKAAHAAHTAATQVLLDANATHVAAAAKAKADDEAAQSAIDILAKEVTDQAQAIATFNASNAPAH